MAGDFPWRKWDDQQNPQMNQPIESDHWWDTSKGDYRDNLVQELLHLLREMTKAQADALGLLVIGTDGKLYIRLSDGEEILLESMDDIKKVKTKKLLKGKSPETPIMHCKVCNRDYTEPSLGGPDICPACDCGIPFPKHIYP